MEESHGKEVSQRQANLTQQLVSLQRRETQLREQVIINLNALLRTANEVTACVAFIEVVTRKGLGRSKDCGCKRISGTIIKRTEHNKFTNRSMHGMFSVNLTNYFLAVVSQKYIFQVVRPDLVFFKASYNFIGQYFMPLDYTTDLHES